MTPAELYVVGALLSAGRDALQICAEGGLSDSALADSRALAVWRCAKALDGETAGKWDGVALVGRVSGSVPGGVAQFVSAQEMAEDDACASLPARVAELARTAAPGTPPAESAAGGEDAPFHWPEDAAPVENASAMPPAPDSQPSGGGDNTAIPHLPMMRLKPYVERNSPLPPDVVKGICNRGEVVLLSGGSKAGKSWFMLQTAVCVGAGIPLLGKECVPGPVAYLNTEVQDAFWEERCRQSARALGVDDPALYVASTRGIGLNVFNVIPAIKAALEELKIAPSMICLDPWYTLAAGPKLDENAAGDVGNAMLQLQKLAVESGAAIWIAHHFTKGSGAGKAQIDRFSGSGAFARAADCLLTLTDAAEGDGGDGRKVVFEATRRNGASPKPLEVEFHFPLWESRGECQPARSPSSRASRSQENPGRPPKYTVETLLEKFGYPGETLSRQDFIARGIGKNAVGWLLEQAVADGLLVSEPGGRFHRPAQEVEM